MQPVRRQTLIGQVTDQLRREIVTGTWPVGSRIPTEPELCEITGTARNTVREAVQALVHAGMLERRQGSGTYVLSASDHYLGEYFAAAAESDLLELRESLEVTAAGLAAQRRTDQDVADLQRLLAERDRFWEVDEVPAADVDAVVEADVAVHRAVVAASHNAIYLEFYDHLLPLVTESIRNRPVGLEGSFAAEHGAVVQAVVDGDAPAARKATRALLGMVRELRR
ncbi:FCD domain-containing protein [Tsukamurella sp. 8F]|uniref:FadR/GntR family transcriptional regulator n=1 Tax=unclassified Tsukamurella TaxID=2633480 RepID=UPI0023B9BF6F|nr:MULTISPECIES: FCD domain-containing protein [unclassified Tsukamurella]MDF0530694.1 FCD domain-containing protein [Tsukamurella sp. 8J]MDF0587895.1 FCD domain-containing protein [Tsukamurella sp. 8F]